MKISVFQATCVLIALLSFSTTAAEPIRWEELKPDESKETFQLGRLDVPMTHDDPEGRTIEIAFVRLPSTATKPGSPIVYLNGGPGQAATPMAGDQGFIEAMAPLRAMGDVILLDQRGTGRSKPSLVCRSEIKPADFFADRYDGRDAVELIRSCANRFKSEGVEITSFNTRESARDLDDLREALGAKKLRLVAFSYGTHLALAAVRQMRDRIERAVLIGTEGPDHTDKLPLTYDLAWQKIGLMAAGHADVFEGLPDLEIVTRRVMARLAEKPIKVTVTDRRSNENVTVEVGRRGLRWILLRDIGDTSDIPYLPALVYQLDKGDDSLLRWFLQKRWNQLGGLSLMTVAMDCASGSSQERRERIARQAGESVFGNEMNDLTSLCEAAQIPQLDDGFRQPIVSDVPILFISGTLDANTPPYQAEEIRWGLTNASHVIVVNAGHEDSIDPPAVQQAIAEFLAGHPPSISRAERPELRFVPVSTRSR